MIQIMLMSKPEWAGALEDFLILKKIPYFITQYTQAEFDGMNMVIRDTLTLIMLKPALPAYHTYNMS